MSNPTDKMNQELKEQKANLEFQNQEFDTKDTLRVAAMKNPKPINLVFEGGGAKGALFAGALKTLNDAKMLSEVRNVAGSSAGGMTAFMVALGYTPEETIDLVMKTDFKILEDRSPLNETISIAGKVTGGALMTGAAMATGGLSIPVSIAVSTVTTSLLSATSPLGVGDAYSLYNGSYIWEGDACLNLAVQFLEKKGFSAEMTFAQLHKAAEENREKDDSSLKDLFLTATNVGDKKTQIFSHLDTPDIKIVDAFRATMSFPFAFKPHAIDMSSLGKGIVEFADGGMRMNYPMSIFNRKDNYAIQGGFFGPYKAQMVKVAIDKNRPEKINPYTLGFKVDSKEECETLMFEKAAEKMVSTNSLIKSLMINSDENVGNFYPDKTIQGHDMGISTLNFGLTLLEKVTLMLSGRDAAKQYIEKMQKLIQGENFSDKPLEIPKLAKRTLALSEKVNHLSTTSNASRSAMKAYQIWFAIPNEEQDPFWITTIGNTFLKQFTDIINTTLVSNTSSSTSKSVYEEVQNKINADLAKTMPRGLNPLEIEANSNNKFKLEHYLITDFRRALSRKDFESANELLSEVPRNIGLPISSFFSMKEVIDAKNEYRISSWPQELLDIENKLLTEVISRIVPENELSKDDFENLFIYYIQKQNRKGVKAFLENPFMDLNLIQKGLDSQVGLTPLRFDYELEKLLKEKQEELKKTSEASQIVLFSAGAQNLADNSTAVIHVDENPENSPKTPKPGGSNSA